jgi:hypothetical protein
MKWHTVIEGKTSELARFLTGKASTVDFTEPSPSLARLDNRELREQINSLTWYEAKKLGIGMSTLHYLRNNALYKASFSVQARVSRRLEVE